VAAPVKFKEPCRAKDRQTTAERDLEVARKQAGVYGRLYTRAYTHTLKNKHTHTQIHKYTHTHIHKLTCIHMHAHTHMCPSTSALCRAHVLVHTHMMMTND